MPTATNAEEYARIVREKSLQRGAIRAALAVLRDAYGLDVDVLSIAGTAEHALAAIRQAAETAREAA